MKNLILKQLRAIKGAQNEGRFSEFIRTPSRYENVSGYLLELTSEVLLVEELDWDTFHLNGLTLLPVRSLGNIHIFGKSEWPVVAAKCLGIAKPVTVRSTLRPQWMIVNELVSRSPVIEIEQERTYPGEIFLCESLHVGEDAISVKSFDRSLRRARKTTIQYSNITKLTVSDGYSRAAREVLSRWGKLASR